MAVAKDEHEELITATELTEQTHKPSQMKIKIGENVKIKMVDHEAMQKIEPEDYFYLKSFENKIGTISEQNESKSGRCSYRVEFTENHFGYFYSKDLILVEQE
mgnify:CR=1 FL=1